MDILNIIPQDIWTIIAQIDYQTFYKLCLTCKTIYTYIHKLKPFFTTYYTAQQIKYNDTKSIQIPVIKYNDKTIIITYNNKKHIIPIITPLLFKEYTYGSTLIIYTTNNKIIHMIRQSTNTIYNRQNLDDTCKNIMGIGRLVHYLKYHVECSTNTAKLALCARHFSAQSAIELLNDFYK